MVIVPALSKGRQTQPPYITALVPGIVGAFPPHMTDAVDAPGEVPEGYRPRNSAPQHAAPTGYRITKNPGQKPGQSK